MSHLIACGVTHHSAPLWLLEGMPRGTEAARLLTSACRALDADGAVVLSTCNRFEIHLRSTRPIGMDDVVRFLAAAARQPEERLRPHVQLWVDGEAVRHVFAVAAGLDSRVLGEEEILGQVRTAVAAAAAAGTLHPELSGLFDWANRAARRSRAAGGFVAARRSVALHAVEAAGAVLGDLAGRRVLLIGAGRIAARAARALLEAGASVQAVTRDPGRARPSWPALPLRPLDDLASLLADCDAVLCAAATPTPLLTADLVRRARAGTTDRLCVIDVSVPRTVDVALTEQPDDQASDSQASNVVVLDLDTLARYQPPAPADTRVRAAERFVRQETEEFLGWRRSRAAGPFIQRLQVAAGALCAESVRRAKRLEPDGAEVAVIRATEQVAAALLHGPILAVREAVAAGDLAAAEAVVALFERGVGGQVLPIARNAGATLAGESTGLRDGGLGQAYLPA